MTGPSSTTPARGTSHSKGRSASCPAGSAVPQTHCQHPTDDGDPEGPGDLTVDVVICAYTEDRWELLQGAVASVQRQVVKPQRIILCIDHNEGLARRCLTMWPPTDQVVEPRVEVIQNRFEGRNGSARNTAIGRVTADVIAFLDDDAMADTDWLQTLLLAYHETGAVALGGAPLPRFETRRPQWFPPEFDWVFGCRYAGLPEQRSPVRRLIGTSMSVRTDALRQVGGFHSDNHDDMDLSHRIAAAFGPAAVIFEPRATVSHFVPAERVTWRYFFWRCYTVNRGKVRAFADMHEAGDMKAEVAFMRQLLAHPESAAARAGRRTLGAHAGGGRIGGRGPRRPRPRERQDQPPSRSRADIAHRRT